MNNPLNLYPHNLEGYNEVKKAYQQGKRIVSEIRATGTGKSYINLQLALDNPTKKIIYIIPSLSSSNSLTILTLSSKVHFLCLPMKKHLQSAF